MSQRIIHSSTAAAARADYLWCVRARLIDSSEDAWREFREGYLWMDELVERRVLLQAARAVA